ncbi:MAG: hypothetical protein EBZ77_03510 [Chitinophagia bacterium]|nr:hypothetical protein [Chitinophagia bacterium]
MMRKWLLFFCLWLVATVGHTFRATAQQRDTSGKMTIYLTANVIIHIQTDSGQINKFLDNAVFRQGTDTLYCDSLYQNLTTKTIEAFSNVRIAQAGGTQAKSDYLRYISAEKIAYMKGNVSLTDGKNRLVCDELTYNLGTKVGVYNNHGELFADSTTVVSETGRYDVNAKDARFTGKVKITDPQYTTTSDDISYNTETKLTRFFAPSKIVGDGGQTRLTASSGYYDARAGLANLDAHATVWYGQQYIEADTLFYDRSLGYGYAYGKVIAWDAGQLSALYCGSARYNRRRRTLQATRRPVLMQIKDADTLYVRADTFYSAPDYSRALPDTNHAADKVPVAAPTTVAATKRGRGKKAPVLLAPQPLADTMWADTTLPLYFIGYHRVRIFSDSLQGVCDSIVYTQADSTLRMIYSPIAWARNSQITGDTICMLLDSNKLKRVYVPNNAFVISLAGPDGANMYDQVQGKTLKAYFRNNAVEHMVVAPNAEAIYYNKDERGAYLGVSQVKSTRMMVYFNDQNIRKIKLEDDVHETLTPLEQANIPATRLSRFKWIPQRRPRSKNELFGE